MITKTDLAAFGLATGIIAAIGLLERYQGYNEGKTVSRVWTYHTTSSYYHGTGLECASRDFPYDTLLKVSHGGKSVLVRVTSKGPSLEYYEKGRHLDLTEDAFAKLADLKYGLIDVEIEPQPTP